MWAQAAEAANPRIALVIGESAYVDGALPTTANDAGLVAQVLQAAGFDVVGARDLDQKSVREALRDFLDKANAAGRDMQAFVYFSGRALQYAGDNYLAPIDARILRDTDVPIEAVKLSDFTHALAAAPGLARVVVVDGARPNPYAQQGQPIAGGLALVDPEPNTLIAFNAAPGSIGVDDSGDYGVYAKTLAGLMRQGGVDIQDVLNETRLQVNQQTQGAQLPWSGGKLNAPYFLFERAADARPVVRRAPTKKPLKQLSAQEAYQVVVERDRIDDYEEFLRDHARSEQAKRIQAILAARREALFWRRAWDQNTPRAYWTYLKYYPQGPHAYDAGRRLDTLAARREPPQDFEIVEFENLPPPPPREIIYADRPVYYFGGDDFGPPPPPPPPAYVFDADEGDDWRDLPPPPRPSAAGVLPALAVAIPLILGARAYYDRPRPDGRASGSAPPPPPRLGPPPLPRGVVVVEPPTAVERTERPRGPKNAGEVKFAAPPSAPAGARRPPAQSGDKPLASPTPTPTPGASPEPQPTKGHRPLPTPDATLKDGAKPTPDAAKPTPDASTDAQPKKDHRPLPSPDATLKDGAKPASDAAKPTPDASTDAQPKKDHRPLPTPDATLKDGAKPATDAVKPTPDASTDAQPKKDHRPLPLPDPTLKDGAKPASDASKPTPDAQPKKDHRPLPLPDPTLKDSAKPASDAAKPAQDTSTDAQPKKGHRPLPPPDATLKDEAKPALGSSPDAQPKKEHRPQVLPDVTPKDDAKPAPKALAKTPEAKPAGEAMKPRPEPETPRPKAAEAPKVESPRPPPPKPEAPRPAPQPAPKVEAPRPAPQPAPKVEAPPAPKPAPAPAAAPAPKPAGAAAPATACGHPGQPHC